MHVFDKVIHAELALTTGTAAMSIGDVVGGLLTFEVSSASGCGIVSTFRITDAANQKEPYVLWLFDSVPTTIADDAAFAPVIADLKKCFGRVDIAAADYTTVNSLAIAIIDCLDDTSPLVYKADGLGRVYGYLQAVDTPDYAAATDLAVRLTVFTS
jgi:hypothetical protein